MQGSRPDSQRVCLNGVGNRPCVPKLPQIHVPKRAFRAASPMLTSINKT